MSVWPQVTYLALTFIGLGHCLANYGNKKVSTYNWSDIVSAALILTILWCGGFFAPLGL